MRGLGLAWQQVTAMLVKRFHHSRRDWKGLISQILLPVLFMVFAMCLGSINSDLKSYPELELSPALYNIGPSYSFFRSVLTVQVHVDVICHNGIKYIAVYALQCTMNNHCRSAWWVATVPHLWGNTISHLLENTFGTTVCWRADRP